MICDSIPAVEIFSHQLMDAVPVDQAFLDERFKRAGHLHTTLGSDLEKGALLVFMVVKGAIVSSAAAGKPSRIKGVEDLYIHTATGADLDKIDQNFVLCGFFRQGLPILRQKEIVMGSVSVISGG